MAQRTDARSDAARRYRSLYFTSRWRAIRSQQLRREPHCRRCTARGLRTPAKVCDHVVPHHGDEVRFFAGPFQSLCSGCHSSGKQREEKRGHVVGSDPTGRPLDPNHPWNRR